MPRINASAANVQYTITVTATAAEEVLYGPDSSTPLVAVVFDGSDSVRVRPAALPEANSFLVAISEAGNYAAALRALDADTDPSDGSDTLVQVGADNDRFAYADAEDDDVLGLAFGDISEGLATWAYPKSTGAFAALLEVLDDLAAQI